MYSGAGSLLRPVTNRRKRLRSSEQDRNTTINQTIKLNSPLRLLKFKITKKEKIQKMLRCLVQTEKQTKFKDLNNKDLNLLFKSSNNNQDLLPFFLPGSSEKSRPVRPVVLHLFEDCALYLEPQLSRIPRDLEPWLSPNPAISYLPLSRARLPHIPHNFEKKPVSFEKCGALKRIFYVFPLRPTFTAKIMLFEQISHHL